MNTLKTTLLSLFCLQLAACGPVPHEEAPVEPHATQGSSLVTPQVRVTALGCTFTLSGVPRPGERMPIYDVVLERLAEGCILGAARRVLGTSSAPPDLGMVTNGLGLAVAFTHTRSPSGSAPTRLSVGHVLPLTLDVARIVDLVADNGPLPGHVRLDTLTQPLLRQLVVTGSKEGAFPGEQLPGERFVAIFEDFFTSLLPPVLSSL